MRVHRAAPARSAVDHQRAVLAAIARREWLLQMLALAAAGCQRVEDRAYARGNTLILAINGDDKDALDPDNVVSTLMFLPLVRRGDRQACLATEWTHSPDYLEWTYRLRPGVRWHDGRPVTVDDVKFTLDLHALPDSSVFGGGIRTECTVHDESTFTVRGTGWTTRELDTFIAILPKHLVKDLDYQKWYDWDFWLRPVGNGPYRYLRYQPGTMVELEANPDYYKGKPRIERVVLKFYGGASPLTDLLGGNVDAIYMNSDATQLPVIANDARFQTYWGTLGTDRHFWGMVWQNTHPLFRDPDVRRALSLAINRRELVQVLNLPSQFSLVDGFYNERQRQRGEASEPRYDPVEARRLLDQSGWRQRGRDGLRERSGQAFRFTALTQVGLGTKAAVYVQDQLRTLGMRMDVQPVDLSVLKKRLRAGEFEAGVCMMANIWSLESFLGEHIGSRNPQMARLLEVVRTSADPEAVDQAYREMSDFLRRDQPFAFLLSTATLDVVHRRVKGLSAPWRTSPLMFTEDLWLEKER